MTTNSGNVVNRFSCPLMNSSKRQINTIRILMHSLESTKGEETLKTEVKLTQLKKNLS